jgi:hypothetical protein
MTVTLSVTDKTATGRGGGNGWTPQRRERPKISEPSVRNSKNNTGSSGNRRSSDSMTVPTSSPTQDDDEDDEDYSSHHTDQDCASTATAAASTTIPLVRSQQHVDDDRREETTRSMTQPRPQHSSSSLHIRWSTVEIREYAIILGDNPSVIRGVPLTMDWTPLSSITVELEDYERLKPHPPRRPEEMLRSASQREELLLDIVVVYDHPPPPLAEDQEEGCEVGVSGEYMYTPSMIRQAHRMISTLRHQRRQTNQMRRWDVIHEQWEKVTRTLQRRMGIRPSKSWERAYLKQHGCSGRSTTVKGVMMRSSTMTTTTTIATSMSTTTMGTS